jgi:hypothetical protein
MAQVANQPFRFVYTSGVTVERDQSKTLSFLSDYRLMRVSFAFPFLQLLDQLVKLRYLCYLPGLTA